MIDNLTVQQRYTLAVLCCVAIALVFRWERRK